jgi:hypothetical protein
VHGAFSIASPGQHFGFGQFQPVIDP